MKILRIIARLNVGGPARHVTLVNAGLQGRGHQTRLLYGSVDVDEASLEQLIVDSGIPATRIPHLGRRVSVWSDVQAFAALLGILFRESPDVVHTHTAKAGALGRVAAGVFNLTRRRDARAIVVHTFHGHVLEGYFGPVATAVVRWIERTLARVTDRVIAISPRQRDDLVDRFHIAPGAKISVVPLGLNLEALLALGERAPSLRDELGIEATALVFLYVGRLAPIKNLPLLLRAFAQISPRLPTAWLVVAGDGSERQELLEQSRRLGVADRMKWVGWRLDLPLLYRTADIVVLSSSNEGTPVAVIEAMAAARPVVATRVGGVPDVVTDGETGALVPASDEGALAAAMLSMAADSGLRARLAQAARESVRQKYGAERLIIDLEALYQSELTRCRG